MAKLSQDAGMEFSSVAGSARYTAILDADVLYPQLIRDLLLTLAWRRVACITRAGASCHGSGRCTYGSFGESKRLHRESWPI